MSCAEFYFSFAHRSFEKALSYEADHGMRLPHRNKSPPERDQMIQRLQEP